MHFRVYISINFIIFCAKEFYALGDPIYPTVLWWTPLTNDYVETRQCGAWSCIFTDDRNFLNPSAFLFYGSNFNYTNLPLPRSGTDIWALLHEESPKNEELFTNQKIFRHFNYTSTFSRFSDLPLTLQYLNSFKELISTKHYLNVTEKNRLKAERKLAPVAYLQSHCDAPSGRDQYIAELMQYVDIDSYGACLNNKELPKSLSDNYLKTIDSNELYEFLKDYKFMIAFENAVCNDYVTEKLWRPLIIGSVPIYYGSPLIEDWLPNNKSAILIKDFSSPKQLADFINRLDASDTDYNEYLQHKLHGAAGVTNKLLLKEIDQWTGRSDEGIFNDFECFICEHLFNETPLGSAMANGLHYNCGDDFTLPKMETDMSKFDWRYLMKTGKYTADVLNELISINQPFTIEVFQKKLNKTILDHI